MTRLRGWGALLLAVALSSAAGCGPADASTARLAGRATSAEQTASEGRMSATEPVFMAEPLAVAERARGAQAERLSRTEPLPALDPLSAVGPLPSAETLPSAVGLLPAVNPLSSVQAASLAEGVVGPARFPLAADRRQSRPDTGRIDTAQMLEDLRFLADDARKGRRTGTPGNEAARAYLVERFRAIGLDPVAGGYAHPFAITGQRGQEGDGVQGEQGDRSGERQGVNVLGTVPGRTHPDLYIVITAHYDHLGVGEPDASGDSIYNGADDNASGTAALLALATYFQAHRPESSILFAALDAEEMGLEGAQALVDEPPVPLDDIAINVNMDMVSRNVRDELYVAGTYHYPFLEPVVEQVAQQAPVTLLAGHDRPGLPPGDDWTSASDHGPFHAAGIPFLYFGVEDHPDYHRPSDEAANIDPGFYAGAVETVLDVVLSLDRDLDAITTAAPPVKR